MDRQGHTLIMPRTFITRQALQCNPQEKRPRGRPKITWRRNVLTEMVKATEEEVDDQIGIISSSKQPSPDGIFPRILNEISTSIKINFSTHH